MKAKELKSPCFWIYLVVVLYLVSMLVYVTFDFFEGADTSKISAFGSILSGVGAFFAGFIAIILFSDWRVIKNYELIKDTSLSLLDTLLNLNSNIESLLGITCEFKNLQPEECEKFGKWCDEFSLAYMKNLIELKSKNNLHHGLVRNFEKDEKLFSTNDLNLIVKTFGLICSNVEIIHSNLDAKENPTPIDLNAVDLSEYSQMIRTKIQILNSECRPLGNSIIFSLKNPSHKSPHSHSS